jgi:hypothetical protein
MAELQVQSLEDGCGCKGKKKGCCGDGDAANNSGNYNIINIGNETTNANRSGGSSPSNPVTNTVEKFTNTIIKEPPKTQIVTQKVPVMNGQSLLTWKNDQSQYAVPVKLFDDTYSITKYREFY